MKKLFILSFLALAPVALADSLDTPAPVLSVTEATAGQDYNVPFSEIPMTVSFVLDWSQAESSLGGDSSTSPEWLPELMISYLSSITGKPASHNGVHLFAEDGEIHAGISVVGCELTNTEGGSDVFTLDFEHYNRDGKLALTYAYDGAYTFSLYVLQNDGSLDSLSVEAMIAPGEPFEPPFEIDYTTVSKVTTPFDTVTLNLADGIVTQIQAYDSKLSEEEIARIAAELAPVSSTDAVPEPGTATLSLLALAALVSRRRRNQ